MTANVDKIRSENSGSGVIEVNHCSRIPLISVFGQATGSGDLSGASVPAICLPGGKGQASASGFQTFLKREF